MMKTTRIQRLRRPAALRALLWTCAASVLLISSCEESPQDSSSEESENEATKEAQSQFPQHLAFYEDLFAKSSCQASLAPDPVTGPVSCTEFKDAVIAFGDNYASGAGQALDYEPTKLPFSAQNADLIIELLTEYAGQTDSGLVFHYGHRSEGGRGEIVYILSKGELIKNPNDTASAGDVSYAPFGSGENGQNQAHYIALELHNGKSYRIIDTTDFAALRDSYADNITYGGDTIDTNHARMAYHRAALLNEFYGEYAAENDLHLYIGHGGVRDTGAVEMLHTPCLAFGNAAAFFELDNIDHNATFKNKGLDIGRLCPPNCGQ